MMFPLYSETNIPDSTEHTGESQRATIMFKELQHLP